MARAEIQTPGGDPPNTQIPAALNNTDENPNRVAAEREALTQSRAAAAAMERGDLAGAQKILAEAQAAINAASEPAESAERAAEVDLSEFGPDVTGATVGFIRRSPAVEKYGRELTWPVGTPLNEDKMPCVDNQEPAFVVGNLQTKAGLIVSRAIPLV
jgi:hypothetical protein